MIAASHTSFKGLPEFMYSSDVFQRNEGSVPHMEFLIMDGCLLWLATPSIRSEWENSLGLPILEAVPLGGSCLSKLGLECSGLAFCLRTTVSHWLRLPGAVGRVVALDGTAGF